ncbi:MAG TPA: protein kinase [Gemmataceae bacterium]|nr:protein kinase [Gemmataceae bacterium]
MSRLTRSSAAGPRTAFAPTASTPDGTAELAARMVQSWRDGERFLAEAILNERPTLWNDPEAALELIYEELCLREEWAVPATLDELRRRFPQWQAQLEVLFRYQRLLTTNAEETRFPGPGETIGEFLLIAEMGRGAHGRVFLAGQPSLGGREVVLKIVRKHDGEHLRLARLQHTHIVPLYSAADDHTRGLHVLCMPYFAGASLAQLFEAMRMRSPSETSGRLLLATLDRISQELTPGRAPRLPHAAARHFLEGASYTESVCWISACLADALQYAHEHDLVHLDLKPSNILLAADGQPMLLDFHLARRPMQRAEISSEGIGGTPAYMSPEQHAAWSALRQRRQPPFDVDARSDIYSLGVVLLEGLTGVAPDDAEQPPRNKLQEAQVSPGLADIVCKCLEPVVDERYASMRQLAGDLRRHLADLPLRGVRNRSLRERWQKWRKRRPHGMAVAVMMLSLIVALAAVCLAGLSQFRQRVKLAESALRDGRMQMSQSEWDGASRSLDRGLTVAQSLPWAGELKAELRHDADRVKQAQRAVEAVAMSRLLHDLADRIRFFGGGNAGAASRALALEPACLLLWEKRRQIIAKLVGEERSMVDAGAKTDLLDLAIFLADMQDFSVSAPRHDSAKSVEILRQAQALLGSSPALHAELLRRDARMTSSDQIPQTAWENLAVGRARLKVGDLIEASSYFEEAVRLEPHGLWPNFLQGQCCYRQGRFSAAARAFSICIGAAPEAWGCFHNRSLALTALGEFEPALADCERAVQLERRAAEPHLQRAWLRLHHWDFAGAVADALAAASLAAGNHSL